MVKNLVTEQRAIEVRKVSDLREAVGTTSNITRWFIDGEEFKYYKGDTVLRGAKEFWELDGPTKTDAKRKLLELIR